MTTTTHVDLDLVLTVAGELRRCASERSTLASPSASSSKSPGRPPSSTSRTSTQDGSRASGAMARSTACWPTARVRHGAGSTLESLQAVRVFDGRGENQGLWTFSTTAASRV